VRRYERIRVSGHRKARTAPDGKVTIREANGELVVQVDEEGGLRAMAHDAIDSRGNKCKCGPLHVRFVGTISVRDLRPDEAVPVRGRDDVFAGHAWSPEPQ
jgi:hypothetical protein